MRIALCILAAALATVPAANSAYGQLYADKTAQDTGNLIIIVGEDGNPPLCGSFVFGENAAKLRSPGDTAVCNAGDNTYAAVRLGYGIIKIEAYH